MNINIEDFVDPGSNRDAIHVAVIKLKAGERLYRSQVFKLVYGTSNVARSADYNDLEALGVVNPFHKKDGIEVGEEFWGFLMPGTVEGMRHHWRHSAFDDPVDTTTISEHELWLRKFCDKWNFDFAQLVTAGTGVDDDWRYVVARGVDLHDAEELGPDEALFWHHLEAFTGKTFDAAHRKGMGWGCSC